MVIERGAVLEARSECVYILATTEEGTRAALKAVSRLTVRGRLRLIILVPSIVPRGIPLDGAGAEAEALGAHYRRLALRAGIDAEVRICSCREVSHIPSRLLLTRAHLILGGQRRRWRPTEQERLARDLEHDGHHVTFVDVDAAQVRSGL